MVIVDQHYRIIPRGLLEPAPLIGVDFLLESVNPGDKAEIDFRDVFGEGYAESVVASVEYNLRNQ
jgi:hypothetical protein